jgi:hypothetical protein
MRSTILLIALILIVFAVVIILEQSPTVSPDLIPKEIPGLP